MRAEYYELPPYNPKLTAELDPGQYAANLQRSCSVTG